MDVTRQRLALAAGSVAVTAVVVAGLAVAADDGGPAGAPPTSATTSTAPAVAGPATSPPATASATPSTSPPPSARPAPVRTAAPPPSRTSRPTSAPPATAAPDPTTPVVRATGRRITAPGAGLSLRLPRAWGGASTEAGPEAAARQLYPDDPQRAAQAVPYVESLPAAAVLLGLDVARAQAGAAFTPNLVALVDASVPDGYDLQRSADAEVAGLRSGFALQDRRTLDFGDVEAVRLTYRVASPASVGVAYVLKERRTTFVLTYSFPALSPAALALADGSAATARVT